MVCDSIFYYVIVDYGKGSTGHPRVNFSPKQNIKQRGRNEQTFVPRRMKNRPGAEQSEALDWNLQGLPA